MRGRASLAALGLLLLAIQLLGLQMARADSPPACRYDVAIGAPPEVRLDIRVDCGALPVARLAAVDRTLPRYLDGPTDDAGRPLERADDGWALPAAGPRVARYAIRLGDMGAAERSYSAAYAVGQSVLAELSAWVLLPQPLPEGAVLHLAPRPPAGTGFATALRGRDGGFDLPAAALRFAGYSVFGRYREQRLAPPGRAGAAAADVRVVTLDQATDLPADEIAAWVDDTARAVGGFWHGFPVDRLLLVVLPQAGRDGVPYGRVIGGGGASLLLVKGERTRREQLRADWVLIHEMVHLGSPFVWRAPWMTEGFATYFEPIIRYRAGRRSEASLWAEFAQDMPRGLDAMEREGLGQSRRGMYWGGAIFMLLADLEIRGRTQGRQGLEDCLRQVLREGGDATRVVSLDWMIDACDRAIGGPTIRSLAQRHVWSQAPVDLAGIWRRLGIVRRDDGQLSLDDSAPEAWLRRAISAGRPGPV
ncbi:MAG: hypothetical protein JNM30_14915 [Rhodospirillales bacterium]|nr:hypothetical protein [Rhodospirillales bacterium]